MLLGDSGEIHGLQHVAVAALVGDPERTLSLRRRSSSLR
jgi:hypothetical protein